MDNFDYSLLSTSTIGLLADWGQTREIRANPKYRETNPFLGEDAKYVDAYFPAVIAANYYGGKHLTPAQRKILWGAMTLIQGNTVRKNAKLGIEFRF